MRAAHFEAAFMVRGGRRCARRRNAGRGVGSGSKRANEISRLVRTARLRHCSLSARSRRPELLASAHPHLSDGARTVSLGTCGRRALTGCRCCVWLCGRALSVLPHHLAFGLKSGAIGSPLPSPLTPAQSLTVKSIKAVVPLLDRILVQRIKPVEVRSIQRCGHSRAPRGPHDGQMSSSADPLRRRRRRASSCRHPPRPKRRPKRPSSLSAPARPIAMARLSSRRSRPATRSCCPRSVARA